MAVNYRTMKPAKTLSWMRVKSMAPYGRTNVRSATG